ncbi:MAG: cytochrome b/b6 domain-containing protein [Pseudomonadales bacterium]
MKKIFVWDLPLRLFHWALVILVSVSLYTGLTGGLTLMDYHMLSGYGILTLLVFRLAWGLFGTRYARFAAFVYSARTILRAARDLFHRSGEPYIGHNPLGSLSVLAFIVALLVQAGTGLFANDDIFTEGPLVHLVSDATSNQLTRIHRTNVWIIAVLIGLHLTAVTFYEAYKRQRLITPMITGKKIVAENTAATQDKGHRLLVATVLLALSAACVYGLINYV